VRSEVLTVENMKMAVFWVVAQCSLVAASTSETSVNFYHMAQHNNNQMITSFILTAINT
jgi:hypothetical protein